MKLPLLAALLFSTFTFSQSLKNFEDTLRLFNESGYGHYVRLSDSAGLPLQAQKNYSRIVSFIKTKGWNTNDLLIDSMNVVADNRVTSFMVLHKRR